MDFGNYIQRVRMDSGKSLLATGVYLEVSRQTIMRLEDGLPTKLTTPQIKVMLDFYGASQEVGAETLMLWRECKAQEKTAKAQGNSKGFWESYSDQVASHYPRYLRLEDASNRILTHQLVLVPGLLQTAEYRRAVAKIDKPSISAVDIERRIELNRKRQSVLDNREVRFTALISEAVLRHRPGGARVMAGQLRAIAESSERDNINVHVIPFEAGSHPGLAIQSFTLLEFPPGLSGLTSPPVVYLNGAMGALYHEQQEAIATYGDAITGLRAVALNEDDTRNLLSHVAKEYQA
ncbi:helix-turn-helix domain-containing protein [Nocardia sp. NPDC057668]|uniref:helix-turn-helix domain-containing protein n=1 Tax=Nocardia sp. NPDC057668 TaxID=3346202 RepID=UPI003670E60C